MSNNSLPLSDMADDKIKANMLDRMIEESAFLKIWPGKTGVLAVLTPYFWALLFIMTYSHISATATWIRV